MHPILIRIGPITIYTYGFWVAIGFFAALALILKEAKRENLSPAIISDLAFWTVASGIIGARLVYIIYNLSHFLKHPLEIIAFWKGGLVFIGGLFFGLLASFFYVRRHHLKFWQLADLIAPGLALGQALGRIGCFSAGCCYGKPTQVPWAVVFKNPDSLAPLNIPLHPTELYHSFACFLIATILFWSQRYYFNKRLLDPAIPYGRVFALYLGLHGMQRFFIEFFRGDIKPIFFGWLSLTQIISVFMIVSGCIIYLKKKS